MPLEKCRGQGFGFESCFRERGCFLKERRVLKNDIGLFLMRYIVYEQTACLNSKWAKFWLDHL